MDDFRFGIWGCGLISTFHADAIKQIEGASIYGAFDLNEESKDKFCEKYDAKSYASSDELVASKNIDAVCVCLPSGLHYNAAMTCIRNRKHVVIEKPIALSSEQAENIAQEAKENGVFVSVISQLRYSDAVNKVKHIIDSGKLGTITLGNAIMKYWRGPEYYASSTWRGTWEMDGGGALMNQGIHGVDLLQYFMGKVVSVSAYSKTLVHNIQTEDTLTAILEYENGAVGTIQATTSVSPGYGRRIEICGSKGTVVLCEDTIETCDIEGENNTVCDEKQDFASASRVDGIDCSLHVAQLKDFIKTVSSGQSPWIDACEGKKSVDIICAIYKAAQTGKRVYLK
ncbi:MAG: Gfo/Idh/MocA family oxidoreductase [Clostridia bacterium]|nr:Gfo/Idh/MocA family oxidoreductase [Clostridia bacterium]